MSSLSDETIKIRNLINTYNIDRRDLAKVLNVSPSIINQRLSDWTKWQPGDMEKIGNYVLRLQQI